MAPTARARNRLLGPPGTLFYVTAAIAVVVALDANSRASLKMLFFALPIWLVLAGIWVLRFGGAVRTQRLRFSLSHWLRWLVIPAGLGLVYLLIRSDVPFDVRLAASRGAMDRVRAEVMAGKAIDRAWIGLYPVQAIQRIPNGMRFVIDDSGLLSAGFAYATAGEPVSDDNPLWCCDAYLPVGDGWWFWSREWD